MDNPLDGAGSPAKWQAADHPRDNSRVRRSTVRGLLRIAGVMLVAGLLGTGCARLQVTSNPQDAFVLWSPDGLKPWRPWPPIHWREFGAGADAASTPTTPLLERGPHSDYIFVTVDKPGYYPPRPKLVVMRALRTCQLNFDLQETPEHFAERQRTRGLVLYRGQWVDPKEQGLVEYEGVWMPEAERTRRIMTAKGLVDFNGNWVTQEEYDALFAAEQRAKGLVEYKDRWMLPGAKAREESIDQSVAAIVALGPPEMFPPKVLGRVDGSLAQFGLNSLAPYPTRWVLSGPSSRAVDLPPTGQMNPEDFRLIPGRYTVAVFRVDSAKEEKPIPLQVGRRETGGSEPASAAVLPGPVASLKGLMVLAEQPLTSGFEYSLTYTPPPSAE